MGYRFLVMFWAELLCLAMVMALYTYIWLYWRRRLRLGVKHSLLDTSHVFILVLLPLLICCVALIYIPSKQLVVQSARHGAGPRAATVDADLQLRGVQEELRGLTAALRDMKPVPESVTMTVDPGLQAELRGIADRLAALLEEGTRFGEGAPPGADGGPSLWVWGLILLPVLALLYFGFAQEKVLPPKLRRASAIIALFATTLTALAGTTGAIAAAVGEAYDAASKKAGYDKAKSGEDSAIPLISFRQVPFPDGSVKLDQRTFVVPFAEEGECADGRPVVGEPEFRPFLVRLGGVLASCGGRAEEAATSGARVTDKALVRLRGFASTSQVPKDREDQCGQSGKAANVEYAAARVAKVQAALAEGCSEEHCEFRTHLWNDEYFHMASELFYDRERDGFDAAKGELNRRVEVTILDAGDCELPAPLSP